MATSRFSLTDYQEATRWYGSDALAELTRTIELLEQAQTQADYAIDKLRTLARDGDALALRARLELDTVYFGLADLRTAAEHAGVELLEREQREQGITVDGARCAAGCGVLVGKAGEICFACAKYQHFCSGCHGSGCSQCQYTGIF